MSDETRTPIELKKEEGKHTTVQQTSRFGFAAIAVLVGLFSEQAVLKLKQVAESLLTEAPKGEEAKPQEK